MIDTQHTTQCLACGSPIIQLSGRGHRKRLYCDDRCRQKGHRKHQAGQETQKQEILQVRIAALEIEVQRLQARLNIEERFLTDTRKRDFKIWLRSHTQPGDTTFFKRFLDDREMPTQASRSLYEARLRLRNYSTEDIELFRDAWKRMLFSQS